ncbi:MAG: hypothetical protein IKD42_01770 [Kiritimatiellae bacterium]|nr:hypothetical protein [Kiritimatiellia bacterium]
MEIFVAEFGYSGETSVLSTDVHPSGMSLPRKAVLAVCSADEAGQNKKRPARDAIAAQAADPKRVTVSVIIVGVLVKQLSSILYQNIIFRVNAQMARQCNFLDEIFPLAT